MWIDFILVILIVLIGEEVEPADPGQGIDNLLSNNLAESGQAWLRSTGFPLFDPEHLFEIPTGSHQFDHGFWT
jgi:hypothetical protein